MADTELGTANAAHRLLDVGLAALEVEGGTRLDDVTDRLADRVAAGGPPAVFADATSERKATAGAIFATPESRKLGQAWVAVPYAAGVLAFDGWDGENFHVTATGNCVFTTFTHLIPGRVYTVRIYADGASSLVTVAGAHVAEAVGSGVTIADGSAASFHVVGDPNGDVVVRYTIGSSGSGSLSGSMTGNINMAGFSILAGAATISATEMGYLDGVTSPVQGQIDGAVASILGLSWKASVRVATAAAGTLASSFENGDTVDGVVLATGDRILIKNQAAPAENGIYVVASSGAPARAADANAAAEFRGATVSVEEGTANADTAWTCTTNATVVLGTTALTWALSSVGAISAFIKTLLDDADAATALATLGAQAANAVLTILAGASADGQALVTAANYNAMRTLLGLVIGTNVQSYSAALADIAARYTVPGSSTAAILALRESTGGGTNAINLAAAATLAADRAVVFQDAAGTIALQNLADAIALSATLSDQLPANVGTGNQTPVVGASGEGYNIVLDPSGGNVTLLDITNKNTGPRGGVITFKQDSTNRTLSFDAGNFRVVGSTAVNSGADVYTTFTWYYDPTEAKIIVGKFG